MLCYRGCGLEATYINRKGQPCCSKKAPSCPVVKERIGKASGETRRKNPVRHSAEHCKRQSEKLKQAWYEGKRGKPETIIKMKESIKANWKAHPRPAWNKGKKNCQIPWNKGKKYVRVKIIKSDDPIYNDSKKYRNRIATRSRITYNQYSDIINPKNLQLGQSGVIGAHHIDHIMSVAEGYKYSVPVELMSAKENLQVIPWLDNIKKYNSVKFENVSDEIKNWLTSNGINIDDKI